MSEEKINAAARDVPSEGIQFDGEVAIVSGAGTHGGSGVGNGAATAILLAKHGANVVLADKEIGWAETTKAFIENEGGECISIQADVTDPIDCEAVVEHTIEVFGKIDILHNNVGGGPGGNTVDATDENWRRSFDLNLMSIAYMCRHAVPHMIESGGGSVINVSSIQARRPSYDYLPYVVSNASVVGITRGMAMDHAEDNIRINCIMPGPIWSPKVAGTRDAEDRRLRKESVPIPREGVPWDVGWAALFLASTRAGWITGITLPVDGGVSLTRGGDRPGMF